MQKYIVHVNEVYRVGYLVEAENEEEALWKILQFGECGDNRVYCEFGYMIEDDAIAERHQEV